MPKQGDGQEGDLGKPSAGRKRDTGKRSGEMQGSDDEMVVASKKVRRDPPVSSSERDRLLFNEFKDWAKKHDKFYPNAREETKRFKIWCSCKEWIDDNNKRGVEPGVRYGLNDRSDLTDSENGQLRGRDLADDPYDGNRRTPEFYKSELGKQLAEEEAEFDKWVAKYLKHYDSRKERKEGFAAYVQNKKRIDKLRKEDPYGCSCYPDELDMKMDMVFDRHTLKSFLSGGSGWIN